MRVQLCHYTQKWEYMERKHKYHAGMMQMHSQKEWFLAFLAGGMAATSSFRAHRMASLVIEGSHFPMCSFNSSQIADTLKVHLEVCPLTNFGV